MAQKRMFDKRVIDSDEFLEMPLTTQAVYFHLNMRADDDGFIDNWKSVLRLIGGKDDDIKVLISKRFIIPFEKGVIVIKHWKINNLLRKDRYVETIHRDEKEKLIIEKNGEYSLGIPMHDQVTESDDAINKNEIINDGIPMVNQDNENNENLEETEEKSLGIPMVNQRSTQYSIVEYSKVENIKENNKKKKFVKPTIEEIRKYCIERKNSIDAEYFYDHYETTGWMVGKNHMKDWKAAIRTWERNSKKYSYSNYQNSNGDSKEWI